MIKILANSFVPILTALFVGISVVLVVDWFVGPAWAGLVVRWPVVLWGSVLVLGHAALYAAGLSVFAALCLLPLLARMRSDEDEPAQHALSRLHDIVLGPEGTRASSLLVLTAVTAAVATGAQRIAGARRFFNLDPMLTRGLAVVAVVALAVLAYRILIARRPGLATRRVLVLGGVLVASIAVLYVFGTFVAPHSLHFVMPLVGLVAGWCAFASWNGREGEGRVRRVALGLAPVLAIVAGVFYESESEVHAALTRAPLNYAVLTTLQGVVDLDGDGYAAAFGGPDCDDLDPELRPDMFEVIGNGIDDNCVGGELDAAPAPLVKQRPEPSLEKPKPNVIFITIDTLRQDHVGKQFNGHSITPVIDGFSKQAFTFETAYAPSTHTDESIPAAMTGKYPHTWHHSGIYFGIDRTLATLLQAVGYETLAVVCLPWLKQSLIRGFELVDNTIGDEMLASDLAVTGPRTTELALQYLDRRDRDRPLFLWVHYYDPHAPYLTYSGLDASLRDAPAYAQEVRATDHALGELLEGLRQRGLFDDTVIALFSDHGEGLDDHDTPTHLWAAYEEIVRVPFILRLPGQSTGSSTAAVSLVDLVPTVVDYLGLQGVLPRDGRSLLPLMRGETFDRGPFFVESNYRGEPLLRAVIASRQKLVYDAKRNSYLLFDLETDPREQHNLVSTKPELFDALETTLWQWWDRGYNSHLLEQKRLFWDEASKSGVGKIIGKSGVIEDAAPSQAE